MSPAARAPSHAVAAVAAQWAARLDAGPLTEPDRRALEGWLAGDPRCLGALQRARALLLMPCPGVVPDRVGEPASIDGANIDGEGGGAAATGRRRFLRLAAGVGGLAVLGGGALLATAPPAAAQTFRSQRGEIRHLSLPGGAALILNTASCVRVGTLAGRRHVSLDAGEVFLDLRRSGGMAPVDIPIFDTSLAQVRASAGAAYGLRLMDGGAMRLTVAAGAATLAGAPSSLARRLDRLLNRDLDRDLEHYVGLGLGLGLGDRAEVLVQAGQEATLRAGPDGKGAQLSYADLPGEALERRLMWRDGRLAFQDDTLAQAAAEFTRYSAHRIVVADPRLARRHISGLFRVWDVEGFVRAAALSLDARYREGKEGFVLYL